MDNNVVYSAADGKDACSALKEITGDGKHGTQLFFRSPA